MTAFATFYGKKCHGITHVYNLRLNVLASRLMDGADYCLVHRTHGHKYIVIKPLRGACAEDEPGAKSFQRNNNQIVICLSGLVSSGEISKRIFEDGGRCKVKRGKGGEIYVCLQEKLEKEVGEDGARGA